MAYIGRDAGVNQPSAARSRIEHIGSILLLSLWAFGYRALIRAFKLLQQMERPFAADPSRGKGTY